jgi:hypothetical protein
MSSSGLWVKKLLILALLLPMTGCYSFGRGVASRVMESLDRNQDTPQCEIRGSFFNGISSYLEEGKTVKVLYVHGIGTHRPGHSTNISENIASSLGLYVFTRRTDVAIMNPDNPGQRLANLRIIDMRDPEASKRLLFYELTWSEITSERKRVLDFDTSGEYAHRRASFNNTMKVFLNDVGPDAMIYMADRPNLILAATQQAVCWMLASDDAPQTDGGQSQVCGMSSLSRLSGLRKYNIVFISHSLGSRIIMDALGEIVDTLGRAQTVADYPALVADLQEKEISVFMLSNQLAFLQIGLPAPNVFGQIDGYCRADGDHYAQRAFKKLNVVAFNDPNDLLSYSITLDFVDRYLDSRMCPVVTNIHINVANPISALGIEVVNPIAAHGNYNSDERVIELITHGNRHLEQNQRLSGRCRMIMLGRQRPSDSE